MSQLPEAFQGHDLTGWTLTAPNRLSRLAMDGERIAIVAYDPNPGVRFFRAFHAELSLGQGRDLGSLLIKTDDYINANGGWAPAPIGYSADPGWQPIETAIHLRSEPDVLGCQVYSGGVQYFVMKNAFEPCEKFTHAAKGSHWMADGRDWPAYPTHWRPLPAPPEAKP